MGREIGQIEISGTVNGISATLSIERFALPPSLVYKLARGRLCVIDDWFTAGSDVFDHDPCAF
jgi:hypothetical protein